VPQSSLCAYCERVAVGSIPIVDGTTGRACQRHTEEFWRRVVSTAAALCELERLSDPDPNLEEQRACA
jgi:hypothetical protein